ncbi:MAG: M20/M25/M40 family metallo-hydrolase [Actinomycetota bacterium]|nr:M20/M25/M40 family metallo-hydrolase [Actinomycetota bacterium]
MRLPDRLMEELFDWLRIPSISTGGGGAGALVRAAEWVCERVEDAGGKAGLAGRPGGNPVAVGELGATTKDAPTALIYGHYDVQGVDAIPSWKYPPFEPTIEDGRIYARGASDDKGNFLPLLHVACELARRDELPVNVRVVVEGEEEAGGETVKEWAERDERGADCAIVFDSDMINDRMAALTVSLRGVIALSLDVRTAGKDLHSGTYGGSVLNATHVIHRMLAAVLPNADGRLRSELRDGITEPSQIELEEWGKLPAGDDVIAESGGSPLDDRAGADYYSRNGADAALDVNGIAGGDPVNARTIVPATAHAKLSMRLAPGQSARAMQQVLEELLLSAAPAGAEVGIKFAPAGEPAFFDPRSAALRLGKRALEQATGMPVAIQRAGGSIPILANFADRGIQTIISGFALAGDAVHAPNESYRVESLKLGEKAAYMLYSTLARLGG